VNQTFDAKVQLQFQTVPELVSGVELSSHGQKVAWSIADYLATLEKSAGEILQPGGSPAPKPDAKPDAKPAAKSNPKPAGTAPNGVK
jgi:F-type H+-transporting ATPase subunit b